MNLVDRRTIKNKSPMCQEVDSQDMDTTSMRASKPSDVDAVVVYPPPEPVLPPPPPRDNSKEDSTSSSVKSPH